MTAEQARQAVEAWVATTNAHDPQAYAKTIAPHYTWRLWNATTTGRDVSVQAWTELWTAFPDLHMDVLGLIAQGDRVAMRFRMSGTHQGPLRFRGTQSWDKPFAPTGRSFTVEGAAWFEVRDGLVQESTAYWLPTQMLQQLGLA